MEYKQFKECSNSWVLGSLCGGTYLSLLFGDCLCQGAVFASLQLGPILQSWKKQLHATASPTRRAAANNALMKSSIVSSEDLKATIVSNTINVIPVH